MAKSFEDHFAHALSVFEAAPFAPGLWQEALEASARATGSRSGQLMTWVGANNVPVNFTFNFDEELMPAWLAYGGSDPAVNPLMVRGHKLAVGAVMSEHEVVDPDLRRRSALWNDVHERYDVPHITSGKLWTDGVNHMVLALIRSRRDGVVGSEQLHRFRSLVAAGARAVTTAVAIRAQGSALMAGALDNLALAVLLLDDHGRVIGVSDRAAGLLAATAQLHIRDRRFGAARAEDDAAIAAMIAGCAASQKSPQGASRLLIYDHEGAPAFIIQICRMPRDPSGLNLPPAATVIITALGTNAVAETVWSHPDLTPAEREVAAALAKGTRQIDIARSRSVSLETVRSQAKTIYSKLGISGQIALMGWLGGGTL